MAATFEISTDKAGEFRFHLKAPNGEIIAASQAYDTKAGAEKGIESVKTNASSATVIEHVRGVRGTAAMRAGSLMSL
jgi:uncharacterized protein YegP (UPF0339 family)